MSVHSFFESLAFAPDPFQVAAAEAVEAAKSVVVTAPTGAGKTLIAEAAIDLCLRRGQRVFYTTPLKALSNQKYGDFGGQFGHDRVGLLTGDNSVNGLAPIVVMTTEVLRNMIYAGSTDLDDVAVVVLDEVHYLQDRFRGAVWEEVIIHCPRHIQLVALSATIANPGEFTEWMEARRGPTELIVEDHRPVPLESLFAVKDLAGGGDGLEVMPMFVEGKDGQEANQAVVRRLARDRGRRRRFAQPRRTEVVEELAGVGRLPAIYFVFSRAGCDEAASAIVNAHVRLTTPEEREQIRNRAEARTAHLDAADLGVLEYDRWLTNLEAGVAAHHAGLVPAFKETVEELFSDGLVKLVFATETLALGINMPARTVVLDRLSKFTGETHELLLPGEYTQLTGRAGRRGIDTHGYGVVLYSRFVAFERMAAIAQAGSHALASSFRPTYNMVVNLIANYPKERAEELLEASFAQFQRDRSLRKLAKALARNEARMAKARGLAERGAGDIWDFVERSGSNPQSGTKAAVAKAAERLKVGDVIEVPTGRRSGRFVVTSKRVRNTGVTLDTVAANGDRTRIRGRDLPSSTEILGKVDVPRPFPPPNPAGVRALGERVAALDPAGAPLLVPAGDGPAGHPVAGDPNRHQRLTAARRVLRLEREVERQRSKLDQAGGGLVAEMQRVLGLLAEWGYTNGWELTEHGAALRVVYSEMDLLVVEADRRGLLSGLDARELTALVSAFVFDPRADEAPARWPTPELEDRWDQLLGLSGELAAAEKLIGLPQSRQPEPGFGALAYYWATGYDLEHLLDDEELAAGDFVRTSRQILDLLRQLRDARPDLRAVATEAIDAVDRGVVAAGGIG